MKATYLKFSTFNAFALEEVQPVMRDLNKMRVELSDSYLILLINLREYFYV